MFWRSLLAVLLSAFAVTPAHAQSAAGLPPGQYIFKVGIFPAGWGTPYAWNDNAGTLTIDGN